MAVSNPSKQKGTKAETAVVRWLQDNGFPDARRLAPSGATDKGDVVTEQGQYMFEVKDNVLAVTGQPPDSLLQKWLQETGREGRHYPDDWEKRLVVKRKGTTDVGKWWTYKPYPIDFETTAWVCTTLGDDIEWGLL